MGIVSKICIISAVVLAAVYMMALIGAAAPAAADQSSQTVSIIYPDGYDQTHLGHPVYTGEFVSPPPRPDYGIGPGPSTNTSVYTSPATQMLEASNTPYILLTINSNYTSSGTVIKVNVPAMQVNGTYMTKRNMDIQYGGNGTRVPFWIDSYRGNLDNNTEANFVYLKANIIPGNNTFLIFWNNTSQPGVNDGTAVFKYVTGYSEVTGNRMLELYSAKYNAIETDLTYVYNKSNWSLNRDPAPMGSSQDFGTTLPRIRLNKTSVYDLQTKFVAYNNTSPSGTIYSNMNFTYVVPSIVNNSSTTNGSVYCLGELRASPTEYVGVFNPLNGNTTKTINVTASAYPVANPAVYIRMTYSQNGHAYDSRMNQSVQVNAAMNRFNVYSMWASDGNYPNSYINYALIYNTTPVTYTISTNSSIPVTSIAVNGYSTVRTGSDYYYYATVLPTLAKQQVTWSVNNTSVATIDSNSGLLRPLAAGTVTVTATATDGTGISGTMTVNVITPQPITVTQTAGGTVSVSAASAFVGDTVSITATPSAGFALSDVTVTDAGGNPVPVTNNAQFVMPETGVTVTGSFVAVDYNVTVMQSPGGSVSAIPAGGNAGQTITLIATPDAGYQLITFTVLTENGTPVQVTDNTFILPAANVSVTPSFSLETFNITISATQNGSITASPMAAQPGETVTLTSRPEVGYMLEAYNITWSGGSVTVRNNTFTMPAGDVNVNGSFMRSVPVPQIRLENGTSLSIGRHTINFTSTASDPSYLFLWQTSYDGFETISESGFARAGSESFAINATRTGILQIRMSPADVMYFTTVIVTIYDRLSEFENLSYDGIFNQYFTAQNENFSGWDVLELPRTFYYESVTPFIFWTVVFAVIYTALYITTGGAFIPAAAFSAVGFILVNVMPLELSVWARVLISIGLFVVPAYKYFKQRRWNIMAETKSNTPKKAPDTATTMSKKDWWIAVPARQPRKSGASYSMGYGQPRSGSLPSAVYYDKMGGGKWKIHIYMAENGKPITFSAKTIDALAMIKENARRKWKIYSGDDAREKFVKIKAEWK